jgi:hypothetical protein
MSSFEPEQLQDLGKAFNIAWDRIAPNISTRGKHVDTARIMLADIIFGLTRHGNFEPQWLADTAVQVMLSRPPATIS